MFIRVTKTAWDTTLVASCNNKSLVRAAPHWTNLSGTPLVVHPPLRQRQEKRNCSHVSTTKGVFTRTGCRNNPARTVLKVHFGLILNLFPPELPAARNAPCTCLNLTVQLTPSRHPQPPVKRIAANLSSPAFTRL